MAEVVRIDPTNFELQSYEGQDESLINQFNIDSALTSSSYIEFYVYDLNQNILSSNLNYSNYTVLNDGVGAQNEEITQFNVFPADDVTSEGFDQGDYVAYYNFFTKRIGDQFTNLYISEISSDRTEIRLDSTILSNLDIVEQTNQFIQFREDQTYFVDFYLNFGNNQLIIANNIQLENETTNDPTILVKLYEPLPIEFDLKSLLWIVTTLNEPEAFQVTYPIVPVTFSDFNQIAGPNFNIPIKGQVNNSSQNLSENDIISGAPTSSLDQLQSLLTSASLNISVDYTDFSDFVHFSSAKTRIENFYYKASLIEGYSASIAELTDTSGSSTSILLLQNNISEVIKNFDGFEYFMYYTSGSEQTWPKTTTEPPYLLAKTGSAAVVNWLGSDNEVSVYYGGRILSASNFDNENNDQLLKAIPEYLREDTQNEPYELFVDMVAQYYDNVWLYTKDITQKYNADNRLDFGVSKDLVAEAIKDFGLKLYQNNFSNDELYTAFLGVTPNGSLFPFPEITGSLPVPTGYEFVDTLISASNDVISMDDTNKSLYKRIYHNIPYLLNAKGTVAGLRALITSYGIPDTILRISEFGGKDKVNENDWDYYFNKFNYAFSTSGSNYIETSFQLDDTLWDLPIAPYNKPRSVEFRFKAEEILPTNLSQSLWNISTAAGSVNSVLALEYSGSGLDSGSLVNASGSYSGSIKDPYYQYGHLKFYPSSSDTTISASVYLPFFDGGWWSVMVTSGSNGHELYAANKIYNGNDGTSIGYIASSSITSTYDGWSEGSSTLTQFASQSLYPGFSGSLQEIRYYTTVLSESVFKDYVMNPLSTEGNGINSSPNQLAFRAALGSELDITTTSSIHPKITGSWEISQSFSTGNSDITFGNTASYNTNTEYVFLDQFPAGIKNRITDKVRFEDNSLPPGGDSLSPFVRVTQATEASASYTENINYLEVAFSPQNQINDDIISQIGYFNIGDYIGDPRQRSSSAQIYPSLDNLSKEYFEKYIKNYDLVDFVRLIKFFDNSLFKMIKDFIPARTSLASGLVVKQHLLERNKYPQPQVSYSNESELSGSIDMVSIEGGAGGMLNPFNINYNLDTNPVVTEFYYSGSVTRIEDPFSEGVTELDISTGTIETNAPNLEWFERFISSSYDGDPNLWISIQNGAAKVLNAFSSGSGTDNSDFARVSDINLSSSIITLASGYVTGTAPAGIPTGKTGITLLSASNSNAEIFFSSSITNVNLYYYDTPPQYNVTQSWSETYPTLSGSVTKLHDNQDEFYDGEFSGSTLIISNGELNESCNWVKNVSAIGADYGIRSYNSTSDSFEKFTSFNNLPLDGFMQVWFQDFSTEPLPPPNPDM